jgi:hypothetical protein
LGESAEFWEGGCYYYVPNDGYLATEAIISVASNNGGQDHLGQTVSILLYEINEDDDTLAFNSADTEILGFGTFTFTDEENFQPVSIPLFSLNGSENPGVELTGGKEYILMVQYTPEMNAAVSQLSYPYSISTVIKDGDTWNLGGFANGNTLVARLKIENIFKSECSLNDQNIIIPNIKLQSPNIAVSNTITSNSRITNNSNVNLSAGSSITLTPGFTVEGGATFSAKIQDCLTEVPLDILEEVLDLELDQNKPSHFSTIFPNPFNSQLNIKLNNYDEDFLVQIFDLMGREIKFLKGYNGENLSIDLSSIDAGIYFVKITGKTFIETKNIVKN